MNAPEKPTLSLPSASEYILDNFKPTDRVAILVLNRQLGETTQSFGHGVDAAFFDSSHNQLSEPTYRGLFALVKSFWTVLDLPIARSITHDDSIGLAHLNCPNLAEKWPFLDPQWTPVDWTLVFRAFVSEGRRFSNWLNVWSMAFEHIHNRRRKR